MLKTYIKESHQPAQACVIWLHGLGADATNMMGVANAFPESVLPIRHVFVDAPLRPVTLNNHMTMRAWYDITGLTLDDREDKKGILQTEQMISEVIAAQVAKGFTLNQIYLAGFSQGGAMALFTAMRTRERLGGVLALSSYLPLQAECTQGDQLALPIFIAAGSLDQVVSPNWTKLSYDFVKARGFTQVTWKEYRMEHSISMEELNDIGHWLKKHITLAAVQGEIR